jgi:hypothetical protein
MSVMPKINPAKPQLFPTQRQARRELNCGPGEIRDLIAAGVLETKAVGKRLRITRKSLNRALQQYG